MARIVAGKSSESEEPKSRHHCLVCHCPFNSGSPEQYAIHARGSRHQTRLKELFGTTVGVDPGIQLGTTKFKWCEFCKIPVVRNRWKEHRREEMHVRLWKESKKVRRREGQGISRPKGEHREEVLGPGLPNNEQVEDIRNNNIGDDEYIESGMEDETFSIAEEPADTTADVVPNTMEQDSSSDSESDSDSSRERTVEEPVMPLNRPLSESQVPSESLVEKTFDAAVKKRLLHIYRLVELQPDLPRFLSQGRLRLIAEKDRVPSTDSLTERDLSSFEILCDLITGLREELVRISEQEALKLAKQMNSIATHAKGADVHKAKTCIIDILASIDSSFEDEKEKLSIKTNRGFNHDKLGEMLCPVDLNWSDKTVRVRLRDGRNQVTADKFWRGLYKDCKCDPDDYEEGLLQNEALVLLAKTILTGLTSALMLPGKVKRRLTNAEILGLKEITPRLIAYCACLLRYAISDQASWSLYDRGFDVVEMYWNIIEIFDGSESSNELLRWWSVRIFGSEPIKPEKRAPSTLEILKAQRAAKRARVKREGS